LSLILWIAVGLSADFTSLSHHSLSNEAAILSLIVAASIGIGFVADRTKSIFAAAAFHSAENIMGLTAYFTVFIPSSSRRLVNVGFCAIVWFILLRLWARTAKL
jgi:membrane protease YdiL (CAAX protease family)